MFVAVRLNPWRLMPGEDFERMCTREGPTPVVSAEYKMCSTWEVRQIWRAFLFLVLLWCGDESCSPLTEAAPRPSPHTNFADTDIQLAFHATSHKAMAPNTWATQGEADGNPFPGTADMLTIRHKNRS